MLTGTDAEYKASLRDPVPVRVRPDITTQTQAISLQVSQLLEFIVVYMTLCVCVCVCVCSMH